MCMQCSSFSVEQENDLLTCGTCKADFPLQDIIKFIRHKVNKCDKENVDLDNPDPDEGNQSDSESLSLGSNLKTSISAPISKKDLIDNKLSSRPSLEALEDALRQFRKANEGGENLFDLKFPRSPLKPKHVNAETNTINSGK